MEIPVSNFKQVWHVIKQKLLGVQSTLIIINIGTSLLYVMYPAAARLAPPALGWGKYLVCFRL